jgi:hypothetical protein
LHSPKAAAARVVVPAAVVRVAAPAVAQAAEPVQAELAQAELAREPAVPGLVRVPAAAAVSLTPNEAAREYQARVA